MQMQPDADPHARQKLFDVTVGALGSELLDQSAAANAVPSRSDASHVHTWHWMPGQM
jgi:hypothetical protein